MQELEQVEQVEPIAIYQNNIYALVDDMKQDKQFKGLTDAELKENKSFFPRLVQYIYNNYIGDLLGNKHGAKVLYKDIKQLDYIFNIYVDLVYKYKWNNRPLLVEFGLLTGINRDTFYNWINGCNNNTGSETASEYLSLERSDVVQKWVQTCERGLLDGSDTIKDIFILKAKYGLKEAGANELNVTVKHQNIISADILPELIDLKTQ